MFRLVTLFALVSCAFASTIPDKLDGRIVNGVDTTIQAHPYQVSIQTNNGFHFCGGSLISENCVLTAAHCMLKYKPSEFKVRLGSTEYNSGGELIAVETFRNHEGYNKVTNEYDVSVIKLATPVRQSSKIRYVKLAEKTPPTGTPAVITGWGSTCFNFCPNAPTVLQEVTVDIVDRKECCSDKYKYGNQVKESMVCAYSVNKDSCQGDSGGPLVADNKLVGIVSWGYGCGFEGYPGVYCDVPVVRNWIEKTCKEL